MTLKYALLFSRLFRDATRYVNGSHVKDLGALNRDLKKVIVVDWNKNSVQLNSENGLILKKWEGDNSDNSLIGLAQLLNGKKLKFKHLPERREIVTRPYFCLFLILQLFVPQMLTMSGKFLSTINSLKIRSRHSGRIKEN